MIPRTIIRWAFHLLYNQVAWSYDLVAWAVSLGQWEHWGSAAIPFLCGSEVLDLAHGPGSLMLRLVAAGYHPTGYDLSPQMGRIAQRKQRRLEITIPLARGRAQQLPFSDEAFDSVVSTFPAEFILETGTLNEIGRVLRPGGRFVLVPIAMLTGPRPLSWLVERLFAITGQRLGSGEWLRDRFEVAGLMSRIEWVSLSRSRVMVVVSVKVQSQEPIAAPRPGNVDQ